MFLPPNMDYNDYVFEKALEKLDEKNEKNEEILGFESYE